jgi:hypothetical protein
MEIMIKDRIISALLTLVIVFGTVANLSILPVFAADAADEEEEEIIDYRTEVYATPEDKLATMNLEVQVGPYELYYHYYTGEIAFRNNQTGDILFSNPYDVATPMPTGATSSDNIKDQLLSQLIIRYVDNDKDVPMYSYVEAALRNQIKKKNLKNGIRVEYILGRQETRKLVPKMIEKTRFETLILANITDESRYKKISAFYTLKRTLRIRHSPSARNRSCSQRSPLQRKWRSTFSTRMLPNASSTLSNRSSASSAQTIHTRHFRKTT